jgi:CheY-like chemotaxis protein/curved DNA-binding protein CbpA
MDYQEFNILIVEDDRTLSESLKAAITRAGFRCYNVASPQDALNYAKLQDVHALVIDCMLPKMNGLELVKKLREMLGKEVHLFLMSGIFKDKQFISSSIQKTGAVDFLTKPFDVETLVSKLESTFGGGADEDDDNFNPLTRLYMQRDVSGRKIIKLLNNTEGLHNFDLPWVFELLIHCKATGHLNIASTNGDIAGVGFSRGHIVQVNIKNEASLIGLLLVEQGYLDRADLNEALARNNNNKRVGQYLIENNLVSPHAITSVLKDQLIWRLKKLITDSQMELNFVKAEDIATIAEISEQDYTGYLIDTIDNIIRSEWLKTHYLPLNQNIISINKEALPQIKSARIYPLVSRTYPNVEALLERGANLDEILSKNPSIEESVLKVIHFFNIMGYVEFSSANKTLNYSHQAKRLQRLDHELESKNFFERLGVSRSAKESDIRKAYFDLAKVLHPDKLSEKTPDQVRSLSVKVFEKIQAAYDTLKKEEKREAYLMELEAGQSELFIEGDQLFDNARNLLAKGQYSQAKKLLHKAAKLNPNSPDIKVHFCWAELKCAKKVTDGLMADIDKRLNQVPLEARDTAAYYHTRGIYYKCLKNMEKARKYFHTALNQDNAFISARRELSELKSKREATNIFSADLKDVVGMLFKK